MDSKLTLKLDDSVIERAKEYAKSNKTSLSKMVEAYLSSLTSDFKDTDQVTPFVDSLTGIIEIKQVDYKNDYPDFLSEKYK